MKPFILLKMAISLFYSINCKRINIEVFGSDQKGLNFYEKNKYRKRYDCF